MSLSLLHHRSLAWLSLLKHSQSQLGLLHLIAQQFAAMNGYQQDQGYVQDQGYGQSQSYGYQGYQEQKLDEDAFGPSKGGIVSSFDAFRRCLSWYDTKRIY